MKIASDFKDYYDCGQKYGVTEPLFLRKNVELSNKEASILYSKLGPVHEGTMGLSNFSRNRGISSMLKYGTLLFCGKIYRFIIADVSHESELSRKADINRDIHCYSEEQAYKYLTAGKRDRDGKSFAELKDYLKRYYNNYNNYDKVDVDAIHAEYRCPIIVTKYNYWRKEYAELNPNLRKLHFNMIMNPYTAFQELSMYIGGVMGSKAPSTVEVSDKVRAEKHGFDEWSFRKPPEEEKEKRKKRK